MTTTQIEIRSPKGNITGTIDECAAWLAETQPAFPAVHLGDEHEELTVAGTPGAAGYRRAIVGALREMGREHGRVVPASPASSDQAWSDARVHVLTGDAATAYVEGHMEGQAE